jgi:hypothetical protein
MSTGMTAMICIGIVAVGGLVVYGVSSKIRPPITQVVQAPSAASAGVTAIGNMLSHGIDAWIAAKVNADKE